MRRIDIRPLKQRMRGEIKTWRRSLETHAKAGYDHAILERLLSLREYQTCRLLLTYVSLPIEIDTKELISRALEDGKRVAVPRCVENSRRMEFYQIGSFAQLAPQMFGVLEPVRDRCELVQDFSDSICIVPALAYDRQGFRLGYGAGYYDRFLSGYQGVKIGTVYDENLKKRLWNGKYDIAVDLIVTEKRLWHPERKKK